MTALVLDASVAVKWYVNEIGSEKALRLLDDGDLHLLTADIFRLEVVNALLRQLRRGQLEDAVFAEALDDLALNMPEIVPSTEILSRTVALARAIEHPIYDCLYLAAAERRDALLLTADAEFVLRCRSRLEDDPLVKRLRFFHDEP
jgi:predicted nucleic acid-binding protein